MLLTLTCYLSALRSEQGSLFKLNTKFWDSGRLVFALWRCRGSRGNLPRVCLPILAFFSKSPQSDRRICNESKFTRTNETLEIFVVQIRGQIYSSTGCFERRASLGPQSTHVAPIPCPAASGLGKSAEHISAATKFLRLLITCLAANWTLISSELACRIWWSRTRRYPEIVVA